MYGLKKIHGLLRKLVLECVEPAKIYEKIIKSKPSIMKGKCRSAMSIIAVDF